MNRYTNTCAQTPMSSKRDALTDGLYCGILWSRKIEKCYYTDSDVMLYDNLTTVFENYKEYDATYTLTESQENYRWAASACCSYWKRETLNKFCDFVLETYSTDKIKTLEEKWNYHQTNNILGGICDMTLLYLFSREINFYSLSKVKNGKAFDHNICVSENYFPNEYIMEKSGDRLIKKITWKNGKPYANNIALNEEVQLIALTEYAKLIPEERPLISRLYQKIKYSFS